MGTKGLGPQLTVLLGDCGTYRKESYITETWPSLGGGGPCSFLFLIFAPRDELFNSTLSLCHHAPPYYSPQRNSQVTRV